MERIIIYVAIGVIFISCNEITPSYKGTVIDYEKSVEIEVKTLTQNRGMLILNNRYKIYSNCPLIYKDNFPEWIKDRGKGDFRINKKERIHYPVISDIIPKYKLVKQKKDSIFSVIKYKDTLRFELIDPNAPDPDDPTIKEFFQSLFEKGER